MANTPPSTSRFAGLPSVAVDEIFALNHAYAVDTHPDKVSLGIGVYRTNDGKPWPLTSVRTVERELFEADNAGRHEYLPIEGDREFLGLARDLMFGFDSLGTTSPEQREKENEQKKRIASVQTISGTGANHLGAAFLARHLKPKHVWIGDPSWPNHLTIWDLQGVTRRSYPHYNPEMRSFDFEAAMKVLESEAEEGDVILLHTCAHNPTGLDPTKEQWKAIAELCQRKRLFPFFDSAYQGFASGSVDEDAWAVRYFFSLGNIEMCVAQSFSKNFGLYGQRVGAFHFVSTSTDAQLQTLIEKNLCHLIRGEYSMAPRYGSTIVKRVLSDAGLREMWQKDLDVMSSRIKAMRQALYDELVRLQTPGSWKHIVEQNGMFSYTGLTRKQVEELKNKYHVYLLSSGRASISGCKFCSPPLQLRS